MKRWIALMLYMILIVGNLMGCDKTSKLPEEHTFPDAEYTVNATDMTMVENKIYYICEEKVYEVGTEEPVFMEFPAQFLSANGMELAVYGNGQIKLGEKIYNIPQTEIGSFVYVDDTFCWSYMKDGLPQIGFYNIKSGETISLNPLTGVECKVMPYQGTKILVLCYEMSGAGLVYDFDTNIMKPGLFAQEVGTNFTAYNSVDNTLMYFERSSAVNMTSVRMDTKESQRFTPSEKISTAVEKFIFSGSSGIFLMQDGTVHVINNYAEPKDENLVVKILLEKPDDPNSLPNGELRLKKISEALLEEYGITLELQVLDADKIKQKQLAGDSDYDIYFCDALDLQLNYPIYAPLESYECITEQFDLMLDGVREACTYDGHIFGVFTGLNLNSGIMQCNDELFAKLGLDYPDENWTYQDYYDLAVKALENGVRIYDYQICWPGDYIARYGDAYKTKSLTDDGTALREMLSVLKELQTLNQSLDNENAETLFEAGDISFAKSETHNITGPTFDGVPHLVSNAYFMQMNEASKNKENAAKVIAEYMKLEYGDNPNSGMILFKETAEKLSHQSDAIAANVKLYKKILLNYKVYYLHRDFLQFANEQMMLYLDDKQDLEYTTNQIYARAKMIFEE